MNFVLFLIVQSRPMNNTFHSSKSSPIQNIFQLQSSCIVFSINIVVLKMYKITNSPFIKCTSLHQPICLLLHFILVCLNLKIFLSLYRFICLKQRFKKKKNLRKQSPPPSLFFLCSH